MPRTDILTALKNSIERGNTLEYSTQVLINSGYSQKEVSEAANYLTGGAGVVTTEQTPDIQSQQQTSQEKQPQQPNQTQPSTQLQQPTKQPEQPQQTPPKKKTSKLKLIILIIVLVILLALLATAIFLRQPIIDFIQNLV